MKNFKFTINGNVYEVGVDAAENGKSNVTVNGKSYVVEVEADVMQATTVRRPLATPSAASKGASGVMKSPLPGKVLKVVVAEGQVVKRGDTLMVIESMKMENNIAAQADGVVRKIMVGADQNILQGDALLEFESVAKEEEPAPAPKVAPSPKATPKAEPKPAPAPAPAPAPKAAASAKSVVSPLPGNIISVAVAVGDTVKRGQTILVMESMKMENNIPAPRDGKVSAVHVAAGKSVMQGDALIDIE
ncbi:MAG: biotin/lipoyl-containing protein [Paludibacteraceae bacterium]|nr:biotin/lipoyl-containing protein [Paludibacteraceae bacterium]